MLNPAKDDEWYDPEKVKAFLGVRPEQVADLLALKGDAVDNIPGAPGIGDKGARDLIERFGGVEAAIERAAEVERKTYRESLQNNAEQIRMSKRLATIATDVPIEFTLESVKAQPRRFGAAESDLQGAGVSQPAEGTGARGRYARARLPAASRRRRGLAAAGWRRAVAELLAAPAEQMAVRDGIVAGRRVRRSTTIGLAWQPGEARAVAAEILPI